MSSKSLNDKIRQATWTLREAAFLVNNEHPCKSDFEPDREATDDISYIYYWLKRQYKSGKIIASEGEGDSAIFTPGTLVRYLVERKKKVSSYVLRVHGERSSEASVGKKIKNVEVVYIAAAQLGWKQCPGHTATQMAELLRELPIHIPELGDRKANTIRKWISGLVPKKPGRPKKIANAEVCSVDLKEVVKNLEY